MAKVFSISMLLCSIAISNTADACQMPDCEFNPQNPKHESTVTTITAPDRSTWRTANQLDETDTLIFGSNSIPYNFQDVDQATPGSVYVLKKDFMRVCTKAKEILEEKLKTIEQKKTDNFIKSSQISTGDEQFKGLHLEHLALHKAKLRLKEYQKLLTGGTSYRHICPGFIIPEKTARCVKQWAFLQND